MPTENRSSKTEQMVSVPRDEVERLVKLLAYQAHPYPSPHAEYWQGVLNQPAEQHQGEIVGYRVQRVTPTGNPRLDRPLLTLATPEEWGPAWKADALYTHADSDEVDQLRLEVEKLRFDLTMVDAADIQDDCVRSENRVLRADLETVKSERDAFGQNAVDLRALLARPAEQRQGDTGLVALIIRDVCETEPAEGPNSVSIDVKALELILLQHINEQHQGEPVANCFERRNGAGEWINDSKSWADGMPCAGILKECEKYPDLYRIRLAYAEQPAAVAFPGYPPVPEDRQLPAPVAVVLPARKQWGGLLPTAENLRTEGWNACLDEIAKLGPLYGSPVHGEPVAVVDERDDGLFIDFIYGDNGNPLRRGDKLYVHPVAGAKPDAWVVVSPDGHEFSDLQVSETFANDIAREMNGELPLSHPGPAHSVRPVYFGAALDAAEVERLRAKQAERDALLREARRCVLESSDPDQGGPSQREAQAILDKIDATLSASAEPKSCGACGGCADDCRLNKESPPSAPVERDEDAEFEKWWHSTKVGERSTFAAASSAWQARAALERKS